jgi:NDP-sugar pyrophosphorylase family protein
MRALLLAAGEGTRLKPYTDAIPKPMLRVGAEPILGYNLAMLAAGGFDDIVVNLHAFGSVVRDYVGDGSRWGVRVRYSEEPELRGTAGALVPLAEDFGGETFAVVFGDNLVELDLRAMTDAHRAFGGAATIAVWQREDVSQSGVAEFGEDARIVRFVEKPAPGETASHWINAGVVIAEPAILAEVPRRGPSDLGRDIFPRAIARGLGLYAYRLAGGLWWFDQVEDYRAALVDAKLAAFLAR